MGKGRATPSKPELPKRPKRPRLTQDPTVNATRDADWKRQLAEWDTLSAQHEVAMRERAAAKKRRSNSAAIVATPASSNRAACRRNANSVAASAACSSSAVDASKMVDLEAQLQRYLQLTHSEVQLGAHIADLEAQLNHPEQTLHSVRRYVVTEEYRRGEHHCLCQAFSP